LTGQCLDNRRRELVRQKKGGIDYIEVSYIDEGQGRILPALCIHFFGKTPNLDMANVRIEGGRRVQDIKVVRIEENAAKNCLLVILDKQGDFSSYTLKLVESDNADAALGSLDQRYAQLDFSFKAGCPSDLDCKIKKVCPPKDHEEPEINYLAKDYASFRQLTLDRMSLNMPEWVERHIPDLGIALVEILAYVGDHLSYFQDAVATEAYLDTARLRRSVRRHVRLIDYMMQEGCNARAFVCIETDTDIRLNLRDIYFITCPAGYPSGLLREHEDLQRLSGTYDVFEPMIRAQSPLSQWDLKDPYKLAFALQEAKDPVSCYLKMHLSGKTQQLLKDYAVTGNLSENIINSLIKDLNYLIEGESIYDTTTFENLQKRKETDDLIAQGVAGRDLLRLNRLLLEDAYPDSILKCDEVVLQEAQSCIKFYTWDDRECCLPKGSTKATLRCKGSHRHKKSRQCPIMSLKEGDILIFEEVKGPRTGHKDDADKTHRHPVRLIKVAYTEDDLHGEDDSKDPPVPLVEIEWAEEDALPFPLCISAIGSEPQCDLIEDISVAIGNVILVDHGQTDEESLGQVHAKETISQCEGEGRLSEVQFTPERFRKRLENWPLTFSQPLSDLGDDPPASRLMKQDPRQAISNIELFGTRFNLSNNEIQRWEARRDLLESGGQDRHFAVEVDDKGQAEIFLGDGEMGRMADAGTNFQAKYRVGNGPSGNVGAETISIMVFRPGTLFGVALKPRNPLPAQGGTAPEPLSEVRLFAPFAFRSELQRAVTADDYAQLARLHPQVQRAAGISRWMGSWYEVQVMIDPLGMEEADESLLNEIQARLYKYRRMGHDLKVIKAGYVPLDIKMTVCVKPDYLRGHVEAALLDVFSNRLLSNGKSGFFYPDNLSFGEGIYLSQLISAAQAVDGVASVEVTKLQRYGELPNYEIENGILSLGPHEVARLDNDPDFPENGRIEFELRGGRC
jgi:predicted phage baseplate assembly protein